jgi:hypothetical protein
MRIVYFVTVLILFLFSCSGKRNNFRLELHEDGSDGSMVYLARRSISGTAVIDSALPDKSGTYVFEGYTSLPDFYVVYHQMISACLLMPNRST